VHAQRDLVVIEQALELVKGSPIIKSLI